MSAFLSIVVPGRPVPKGRPRLGANGHVYTPQQTKDAEGAIGWAARTALRSTRPLTGPISVTAVFHITDRRRRDLDNLVKTVLDALNGIAWNDDSQVVHIDALMVIDTADPHTEIAVRELPGIPHALTTGSPA